MAPEQKSDKPDPQAVALFRYALVSAVLSRESRGEVRAEAVQQVARGEHVDGNGRIRRVSIRSLYRWLKAYENQGFDGLQPQQRETHPSTAVPQPILDYLQQQKVVDPAASIPELIRRAEQAGLVETGQLKRGTVWRVMRNTGIPTRYGQRLKSRAKSRFAYAHRMQMVLCDGKHFRAGPDRVKRVVLFFIDDATRFVLAAVVGPSESSHLFLRGLHQAVRAFGVMKRMYTDHGSGFTSRDGDEVMAALGIHIIHGAKGYPQARGKVERFNRTASQDLLRHLDRAADIDPDCSALERRITHYVHEIYNQRPHAALDGKTPKNRFFEDPLPLNFPEPNRFEDAFVVTRYRKVSEARTVAYKGVTYETPPGCSGTIPVCFHLINHTLSLFAEAGWVRLDELDPYQNAKRRQPPPLNPDPEPKPAPTGSAQSHFAGDFAPIVDQHGNYYDQEDPNDPDS